jgi:valyl-tRNA synthetase
VADVYGSDAVRAALVAGNTPGRDTAISEDKIRGYRNFATKVWNIARFILMNRAEAAGKIKLSPGDKRRIAQARKVKAQVAKHIEKFEFHLALEKAYHYTWHTFADKIIEEYKPKMDAAARRVLQTILIECLTILHPFMPFVTEEIYQKMRPGELLLVKKW